MNEDEESLVRSLIEQCRIDHENGSFGKALENLVSAITLTRGQDKVVETLLKAKQRIAELREQDDRAENRNEMDKVYRALNELVHSDCILNSELGGNHILQDAFSDGSSVICGACKSLVPRLRWEQHNKKWCSALPPCDDDDL